MKFVLDRLCFVDEDADDPNDPFVEADVLSRVLGVVTFPLFAGGR